MKRMFHYFSRLEITLWSASVFLIVSSFCVFDRENHLTLLASLIGITSLIFNAKGNPFGQLLMVIFSLLYGVISYTFSYYGEMITYLGNRSEVKVNAIGRTETAWMWIAAALVTGVFYFILAYFETANLLPSTLSVTTSFLAVYLTFRRSPYFAVAYAANDVILIVLWVLASMTDIQYMSVVVCFAAFLLNDIYGFVSWQKMKERQRSEVKVL